jgi:F-type H+-transporting ATPase subunit epsilon
MHLDIITPEKSIYSGKVELIQLPGATGSFEILKNHAPMIASLRDGNIKIVDEQKKVSYIEINGGTLQVENNKVLILSH